MKKLLSIVLVLAVLFSFAALVGCNSTEDAPPAGTVAPPSDPTAGPTDEITEEMLKSSKPNEYVPEKLEAGMEVFVAFNPASFDGIGSPQNFRLEEELKPTGITYICTSWENDTAKQLQQIENWVTMGVSAIIVHTADPAGIEDIATLAEEAGSSMIFYGTEPSYFCSGITSVDLDALGYSSGLIARAWIDQTYPDAGAGEIEVGALGFYLVTEVGWLTDAERRAITDDPRCEIVYKHDDCTGIDKGYTAVEEAFMAHPDIKVIVSYDLYAAFGASNYIMTIPNANPDDYCVVGTTSNESTQEFLEYTKSGNGVFRGTTTGDDDPAAGILECIDGILFRGEQTPYVFMEKLNALTSFDFDYDAYFNANYSK